MNVAKNLSVILTFSALIGCGGDDGQASNITNAKNIVVPEECIKELPQPKEDCLITRDSSKSISMDTQEDVDLICSSSCTALDRIAISEYSDKEALKTLKRLTYIRSLSFNNVEDASVVPRLQKAYALSISSSREKFSLKGLENLIEVEAAFEIESESLINLRGLENLERVGVARDENGELVNKGRFAISSNYKLKSLDGLDSLKEVGEFYITNNPELVNIDGASSVTQVLNGVVVSNNRSLQNIEGLNGLEKLQGAFHVEFNPKVPQCDARKLLEKLGGEESLGRLADVKIKENLETQDCL